ncbi:zinc finger protein 550-like [Clinocottus analis]|uniref:zinc finger protein 550-like n=1 Tax=Clinocottus analis TaxID=304258 RepID=UPI0035C1B972
MSRAQKLRSLVEQRLTAAAQEIFGLFERTIAEYEEELSASRDENERQRRLLDAVFNPEVRVHRADVQQLSVVQEEDSPEQQDWRSILDQEDPEPPHIKEEQEELWISQQGEQLEGLEEAGIKFSFTPVKSEDDEEEAQSSQRHQRRTEQMETETDGEDCGGPEPDSNSDPERHPGPDSDETSQSSECETYDSRYWEETQEPQPGLNPLQDNEAPGSDVDCNPGTTAIGSSECDGSSDHKSCLKRHTGVQTLVNSFKCSGCDKRFESHSDLRRHLLVHAGDKLFTCSVCGKRFRRAQSLKEHVILHTGKKPFTCSVCAKKFSRAQTLKQHFIVHTGEEPFSCSVCGRIFARRGHLKRHMSVHTGDKPFHCSACGKTFTRSQSLKRHFIIHTGKTK